MEEKLSRSDIMLSSFPPSEGSGCPFRLVLIGSASVGKTSLCWRFVEGSFSDRYRITGVAAQLFCLRRVDEDLVKFEVWDAAGQSRFWKYIAYHYRLSDAVVIVYDVTCKISFERAKDLILDIRKEKNPTAMILVGNKCDLLSQRRITEADGQRLASKNRVLYFETSAKNNINVKDVFHTLYRTSKRAKQEREKFSYKWKMFLKNLFFGCCFGSIY